MLSLLHRHPLEVLHNELNAHRSQHTHQASGWSPHVDIRETAEFFILEAELPGVGPEDLTIEVNEDLLTLKGERKKGSLEEGENLRQERRYGPFSRSFRLSDSVSKRDIKADVTNGVLTLRLSKVVPERPQEIAVSFH